MKLYLTTDTCPSVTSAEESHVYSVSLRLQNQTFVPAQASTKRFILRRKIRSRTYQEISLKIESWPFSDNVSTMRRTERQRH